MAAVRVIFDGHTFVPQEPISLPAQSEAIVFINSTADQKELDNIVRQYYQSSAGADADDAAWAQGTSRQSHRAWDED